MMRSFIFLLTLVTVATACVSSGKLDSQGYTHERLGYSLAFVQAQEKVFINPSWDLEVDAAGNPDYKKNGFQRLDVQSYSSHKQTLHVKKFDLVFNHRQTNGVIFVQSSPLADSISDKKLSILVKDQVERLSAIYQGNWGSKERGLSKNLVTNIVSSTEGSRGSAETFEAVVDVANAEQLKLNPEHRLFRFKTILIRPKAPEGWKSLREDFTREARAGYAVVEETYPALIVLTYVMDHTFYNEYLPDFEGLVQRLKLRS